MPSGRSSSPSCALPSLHPFLHPRARRGKRQRAEGEGGGLKQSVFGPCSQKRRCKGWWQRPRWIRNPRVETVKHHLPHVEPWTPPILSLVPQRPGSNSTERAARIVWNKEHPHVTTVPKPQKGKRKRTKLSRSSWNAGSIQSPLPNNFNAHPPTMIPQDGVYPTPGDTA